MVVHDAAKGMWSTAPDGQQGLITTAPDGQQGLITLKSWSSASLSDLNGLS